LDSPRARTRTRRKESDGDDEVPMLSVYDDDVASCSVKTTISIAHLELRTWKDFISTPASRKIGNK